MLGKKKESASGETGEKQRENGYRLGNGRLLIPVYLLLFFVLGCVTCISLLQPQNNLLPYQMIPCTFLCSGLFLGGMVLMKRLQGMHGFLRRAAGPLTVAFGVLLYAVCCRAGNHNTAFADYANVYQCAAELAGGRELSFPHYFEIYSNNVMPALFLSVFFRIADLLSVSAFRLTLLWNVLNVLFAIWAVAVLAQSGDEKSGDGKSWGSLTLLLTAVCLPVYVFTGTFYTDAMSFGFGIIALACLKKGGSSERGSLPWAIAAGFAAVYGAEWKMTASIPLMAGACLLLVHKPWRKKKLLLWFAFSCLFFFTVLQVWSSQYEFALRARQTGNPLSSWIAIGARGDGSWNESRDFVDHVNELNTKEEKKAYTGQYLSEHWREAFTYRHLLRKIRRNFASGMLGCHDYLSLENEGTLLWNLMAPWGKNYWRASQITFCYIATVYLVMWLGCLVSLIDLFRGRNLPAWKMLSDISFLGIFLFLLLWESNNRQLYNQLPALILGLLTNGRYLCDVWRRKLGKKA